MINNMNNYKNLLKLFHIHNMNNYEILYSTSSDSSSRLSSIIFYNIKNCENLHSDPLGFLLQLIIYNLIFYNMKNCENPHSNSFRILLLQQLIIASSFSTYFGIRLGSNAFELCIVLLLFLLLLHQL